MKKEVTISLLGTEYSVERLTVQQIHSVGHMIFEHRRKQTIDDCNAVGMDNEQTMSQVSTLRSAWEAGTEVKRQAYTELGGRLFVAEALRCAGINEDVLDDVSDLMELARASAAVCGLWDPFEPDDDAVDVDPEVEEIINGDQG